MDNRRGKDMQIQTILKGYEIYANTREYSSLTTGYFNKKKKQHYDLRDSLTGAEVEQCLKYLVSKGHTKLHNDMHDTVNTYAESYINEYDEDPVPRMTISNVHDEMNSITPPEQRADKNWYKLVWGVYTNTIEQLHEEAELQNTRQENLRDILRKPKK